MLRLAKKRFYGTLNISNTKQFWKAYEVVNKESNSNSIPTLVQGDTEASTDKQKTDLLNTFFSSCWNMSNSPLSSVSPSQHSFLDDPAYSGLFCSEEEVFRLIMKLDCSKSTGPDGISARMLRETALSITQPLTSLFNMLIQRLSFPSLWKFANVVPIPKNSTCKSSPSNYRPISLLPVISKLFEKHIYSVLLDHFQHHCPISQHQWGFQAGKSTTTALAATIHDWHSHLDVGRDVATVLFDFKKAFDTVPHGRLLEKLSQVHLCTYVVDLIDN